MRAAEMVERDVQADCREMVIQFLAKAESRSVGRLGPVVALDDKDVDVHGARAQCLRLGIFGRAVAGERGRMVLELKHYVAAARLAFHRLECAAAHQKSRAVFAKHLREGDAVGLVPFRLNNIDAPNPISLRHVVLLIFAFSPPDFSRSQKGHCGNQKGPVEVKWGQYPKTRSSARWRTWRHRRSREETRRPASGLPAATRRALAQCHRVSRRHSAPTPSRR